VASVPDLRSRDARPATVAVVLGAWALCVLFLLLYLEHRPKPRSSAAATAASPSAAFPAPPADAVVFSREAGPDALALGVVPLGPRVRVQASVVGSDALGVSGLSTRFALDGASADGVACGAGCYRATFPERSRPRVVEVSTKGKLTTSWRVRLPLSWPPASASQMIAESRRVWRSLRSLSFTDRLASDPEHVVTSSWQVQAPDRLAYQIVKGYSAVVVGKHRWDKPPGGRWKHSPQLPLTQPTPPWTTATNAHVLGATKVRGRPALRVSFYDPETPGWFTVVLERKTLRTLELHMITTAHFMHEVYGAFNAAPEIRAPGRTRARR
jgi:hypothetical protein